MRQMLLTQMGSTSAREQVTLAVACLAVEMRCRLIVPADCVQMPNSKQHLPKSTVTSCGQRRSR